MSRTNNGMAGIVHTAGSFGLDPVHLSRSFPLGVEPGKLTLYTEPSVRPDRILPLCGDDWDEEEDEFFDDDDEDDDDDDDDDAFGDDEDDFDDDEEEEDDED